MNRLNKELIQTAVKLTKERSVISQSDNGDVVDMWIEGLSNVIAELARAVSDLEDEVGYLESRLAYIENPDDEQRL